MEDRLVIIKGKEGTGEQREVNVTLKGQQSQVRGLQGRGMAF